MSLIVSLRRRRLPHSSMRMMPGTSCRPSSMRLGHRQRLVEADALAHLVEEREPFEDLLLRLGAEALELGDLARLAGGLELVEVVDAELVVERLDLLRPQARQAQHLQAGPAASSP